MSRARELLHYLERLGCQDFGAKWFPEGFAHPHLFCHLHENWKTLQFKDKTARGYAGYQNMPIDVLTRFVNARLGYCWSGRRLRAFCCRNGFYTRDVKRSREMWDVAPRLSVTTDDLERITTGMKKWRCFPDVVKRFQVLLMANQGRPNSEIARELAISRPTVLRWRARFAREGLEGLLKFPSGRGHRPVSKQRSVTLIPK